MEIKSFPFECKVDIDKSTFEGYASVFGNIDSYRDIVEHGAFTKTIGEFGHRVKVLWMHDPWTPIGRPTKMLEDSKGLQVEGKVSKTSSGRDALILMADGVVNELSIGYDPIKETWDNEAKVRRLTEVKLWEFSPVTWAANELATVTGVKSIQDLEPLLKKMQGLPDMLKAGRVLSEKNRELVKQAIEALQALIDAAEPSKGTPGRGEPPHKGTEPEFHSLLDELRTYRKNLQGVR